MTRNGPCWRKYSISSRHGGRVKQELAKQVLQPADKAGAMLRIVLIAMFFSVVNSICTKRGRGGAIVVDSTDLTVDLNWFRRKITRADLEERDYDWGYSPSKGFYIGYKLTLAIKHPSLKPLAFLLHRGSPNDAKLFEEILKKLKRR